MSLLGRTATAWVSRGPSSSPLYTTGIHVVNIENSPYWRQPSRPTPAMSKVLGLRGCGNAGIIGAGCSHGDGG